MNVGFIDFVQASLDLDTISQSNPHSSTTSCLGSQLSPNAGLYDSLPSLADTSSRPPETQRLPQKRVRCGVNFSRTKVRQGQRKPAVGAGDVLMAVHNRDYRKLQSLLHQNPSLVDCLDDYGWTPLMIAACGNDVMTVKTLLQFVPDLTIRNRSGNDVTDIVRFHGLAEVVGILEQHCVDECEELSSCSETQDDVPCNKCPSGQLVGNCNHHLTKNSCSRKTRCLKFDAGTSVGSPVSRSSRPPQFCSDCHATVTDPSHSRSMAHLLAVSARNPTAGIATFALPVHNRGYQLMRKYGWDGQTGLGSDLSGKKFPVKTVLKRDRAGFGLEAAAGGRQPTAKITHFDPFDRAAVKRKLPEGEGTTDSVKKYVRKEKRMKQFEQEFRREFY